MLFTLWYDLCNLETLKLFQGNKQAKYHKTVFSRLFTNTETEFGCLCLACFIVIFLASPLIYNVCLTILLVAFINVKSKLHFQSKFYKIN